MSTFKLLGQKIADGRGVQIDPNTLGSANVVIVNVPCLSSVYVGAAVRMDSGGTAQNAIADSLANANVIGIVESKDGLNLCNIRVLGVSASIFAGLDVTKEYFLSDSVAGQITTTSPTTTGHVMLKLGQPFSATEFLVNKGQQVVRL